MTRRELLAGAAAIAVLPEHEDAWGPLAKLIQDGLDAGDYPGAGVIAMRDGRVRFERYWGVYMGLHGDPAMAAGVRHPLYSFCKLVSSTVVAMAVQDGLVDYAAPVSRYVPEFAAQGKGAVTIRHLLTHSAGIPGVPLTAVRNEEEWAAAVRAVCAAPLEWAPGSRSAYHALTGLFTAAECVRRASGGATWEAICRKRLFGPLGVRSLSFATPDDASATAIVPRPKARPTTYASAFGLSGHPAGGGYGTLRDALKVVQLHTQKGVWNGRALLKPEVWAEMHRVQYGAEIAAARAAGKDPSFEPWGLGPLLRGPGRAEPSAGWFGFANQTGPAVFGHAGIDTVIGVGDPDTGCSLLLVTSDSPKPPERVVPLRCGVTDRVMEALKPKRG
jgi:CubicO group peptidase (beta-lactamase class C family)